MIIFSRKAYTLVEIMIVVAIIAILLSVAITNYLNTGKAAAKAVCISNLKQIDGAIERWAIDNGVVRGTQPDAAQEEEIYGYIEGGKPSCPAKGSYAILQVGIIPQVRCSKELEAGHKLVQ